MRAATVTGPEGVAKTVLQQLTDYVVKKHHDEIMEGVLKEIEEDNWRRVRANLDKLGFGDN